MSHFPLPISASLNNDFYRPQPSTEPRFIFSPYLTPQTVQPATRRQVDSSHYRTTDHGGSAHSVPPIPEESQQLGPQSSLRTPSPVVQDLTHTNAWNHAIHQPQQAAHPNQALQQGWNWNHTPSTFQTVTQVQGGGAGPGPQFQFGPPGIQQLLNRQTPKQQTLLPPTHSPHRGLRTVASALVSFQAPGPVENAVVNQEDYPSTIPRPPQQLAAQVINPQQLSQTSVVPLRIDSPERGSLLPSQSVNSIPNFFPVPPLVGNHPTPLEGGAITLKKVKVTRDVVSPTRVSVPWFDGELYNSSDPALAPPMLTMESLQMGISNIDMATEKLKAEFTPSSERRYVQKNVGLLLDRFVRYLLPNLAVTMQLLQYLHHNKVYNEEVALFTNWRTQNLTPCIQFETSEVFPLTPQVVIAIIYCRVLDIGTNIKGIVGWKAVTPSLDIIWFPLHVFPTVPMNFGMHHVFLQPEPRPFPDGKALPPADKWPQEYNDHLGFRGINLPFVLPFGSLGLRKSRELATFHACITFILYLPSPTTTPNIQVSSRSPYAAGLRSWYAHKIQEARNRLQELELASQPPLVVEQQEQQPELEYVEQLEQIEEQRCPEVEQDIGAQTALNEEMDTPGASGQGEEPHQVGDGDPLCDDELQSELRESQLRLEDQLRYERAILADLYISPPLSHHDVRWSPQFTEALMNM